MKIKEVTQISFLSEAYRQEMLDSLNRGGPLADFFCCSDLFLTSNTSSDDQIENLKKFLIKGDRIIDEKMKSKAHLLNCFKLEFVLPHEKTDIASVYMKKHSYLFHWNKVWKMSVHSQTQYSQFTHPPQKEQRTNNVCSYSVQYTRALSDVRPLQMKELNLSFVQYLSNQTFVKSALEQKTIHEGLQNVE